MNHQSNDDERGQRARRSLRILAVEDHADTRQGLALFLRALGHEAQFARDLQEALILAAREGQRFDLLLSDLQLPDGNGWDLLRRLREAGCAPAWAIAISGWGSRDDVARSQAAGFRAHLVKPATPRALAAVLDEAAQAIQASRPARQ
jgi:CheY-like chemotaxis protein